MKINMCPKDKNNITNSSSINIKVNNIQKNQKVNKLDKEEIRKYEEENQK